MPTEPDSANDRSADTDVPSASAQWGGSDSAEKESNTSAKTEPWKSAGEDQAGEDSGSDKPKRRRSRGGRGRRKSSSDDTNAEKNEGSADDTDSSNSDDTKDDKASSEASSDDEKKPRRTRSASSDDGPDEGDGSGGGKKRRRRGRRSGRSRGEDADSDSDSGSDDAQSMDDTAQSSTETKPTRKKKGNSTLKPGSDEWKEIFSDETFESLGLRKSVCKSVAEYGYVHATHIQAKLIPAILEGRDVLGQARTGTGKTAAFGMPLFHKASRQTPFQSIVLAPTRELAIQIAAELDHLGRWTPIRVAAVYGGKRMDAQIRELEKGPDIIVATPGRLMDVVERRAMHLKNVKHIVLDEVDRMLDIGFRDDIKRILSMVKSKDHQTIFVSATISDEIEKLAKSFMKDPLDIRTSTGSLTVSLVEQHYISVQPWDKRRMLIHLLKNEQPELCIIFCQMKRTVDKIQMRLQDAGLEAVAIHGDMMQRKRNSVITRLRDGELHLVVASDLAARGLDVDGITHVVNFDLPEDPEVYIHRIGRTARAGHAGKAFSLVTPEQGPLLTAIEHEANAHVEQKVFDDFEPGDVPDEIRAEKKAEAERIEQMQALSRYTDPEVPAGKRQADASKFPGGIVPSKLPPKLMRGRVKTSRSVKQEAANQRITGRD